jgi:hypothetical protein
MGRSYLRKNERDLKVLRKSHLAHTERNKELLEQHLSGMGGDSILRKHGADLSAVVVDDAHLTRLTGFPPQHDSPLFVDANAVKPAKVAPKRLQAVARRFEEVLNGSGGVQHIELPYHHSGDLQRDPPDRLAADPVVERLGSPIPERCDHRGLRRTGSCPIHGVHAIGLLHNGSALLYHRVLRDGVRVLARDLRATTVREGQALSRHCDYVPQLAKIEAARSGRRARGELGRRVPDASIGTRSGATSPRSTPFRAMAGFHDVLVRGYLTVDLERLHRVLNEHIDDFVVFAEHVERAIAGEGE